MRFLDVGQHLRWWLALSEQIFVSVKNLLNDTVSRSLVDLRVTAGLVNNNQAALSQVFINIIRVIGRRAGCVPVLQSANLARAVRIGEHFKNLAKIIVSPRTTAAVLHIICFKLNKP